MGIENQKRIEFNSTNQECPIVNVPTAYPVSFEFKSWEKKLLVEETDLAVTGHGTVAIKTSLKTSIFVNLMS